MRHRSAGRGACIILLLLSAGRGALAQCDPVELARLSAWDPAANNYFGYSVALDGDVAVVGMPWDDGREGAAYVFTRTGGAWTYRAKLTASDAAPGDDFGLRVAVDGDTLAIAAPNDDHAAGVDAGSVYMFARVGETWNETAKLMASDAAGGDRLGAGVALAGERLLVGASRCDLPGAVNAGAAYMFVRTGGNWIEADKWTAQDAAADDEFGTAVALRGTQALVAALWDDHPGAENGGSVYVFTQAGGEWAQSFKLFAMEPAPYDWFGNEVALGDGVILVADSQDDHAGGDNAGSVYVFTPVRGAWVQSARLVASDPGPQEQFGKSLALDGSTLVVGAEQDSGPAGNRTGAVYVLIGGGAAWDEVAKVTASDASPDDLFGHAVALSGGTALSGAPWDDHAGGSGAGSAYVLELHCPLAGDANCDQQVNFGDINAFVLALTNPAAWQATYPGCNPLNADCDGDGAVGFGDINPLVALLAGG